MAFSSEPPSAQWYTRRRKRSDGTASINDISNGEGEYDGLSEAASDPMWSTSRLTHHSSSTRRSGRSSHSTSRCRFFAMTTLLVAWVFYTYFYLHRVHVQWPQVGPEYEVFFFVSIARDLSVRYGSAGRPVVLPEPLLFDRASIPRYGGLEIRSVSDDVPFRRIIQRSDHKLDRMSREQYDGSGDDGRPFGTLAKYDSYENLNFPSANGCYRPKWSYAIHPTCNHFHETSMQRPEEVLEQSAQVRYLADGAFRSTWLLIGEQGPLDSYVLKTNRLLSKRFFNPRTFSQTQIEALSLELTSSSNRTMDIYGHCGASVFVERGIPVDDDIRPERAYLKNSEELLQEQSLPLHPHNNFTNEQKLDMALAMAESLAVLHGNPLGIIVNDDISISQWLIGNTGQLKLNDFGNGIIREWNPQKQEYCKFRSRYHSLHRAPEEMMRRDADEAADVCAVGKMFFSLLTGMLPYYEYPDKEAGIKAIRAGKLPYVDPRYRDRSLIERRLIEIMEKTWVFEPSERVDIFAVVEHLRETVRLARGQIA